MSGPAAVERGRETAGVMWRKLLHSHSPEDLRHASPIIHRRKVHRPAIDLTAANVIDGLKASFQHDLRKVRTFVETAPKEAQDELQQEMHKRGSFAERVAAQCELFDAKYPDNSPPASTRLDAYIRVELYLRDLHLRRKRPYNPEKNANTAIDVELLRYLAVPATVCSGDGGLVGTVRSANSWQADRVLAPDELKRADAEARIRNLGWPCPSRVRGAFRPKAR
jgi:hypothetical protein